MKSKRWIVLVIILALLAGCAQEPEAGEPSPTPIPEKATAPSPTPARTGATILADGIVQTVQPALPLAFETSGKLLAVHVQAGDLIQAGDLVATLDDEPLREAVADAELAVAKAENGLAQAQLTLDSLLGREPDETGAAGYEKAPTQDVAAGTGMIPAKIRLEQAERNLADAQEAYDKAWDQARDWELLYHERICYPGEGGEIPCTGPKWTERIEADREGTARGLQAAQDSLALARADYSSTLAGLKSDIVAARLRVEQAGLSLEQSLFNQQQAENALAQARLVAPVSGKVLSVDVAVGAAIGAGTPVITLLDADRLEFHTTNLSERDLPQISPGQAAVVTLKAYPSEPIEAAVVRIGLQAGSSIGDAATFPVTLVLSETDLDIRPGMTGRVEIRILVGVP